MPLQLSFDGGVVGLHDVFLIRQVGKPTEWHFLAESKPGVYGGGQEDQLAQTLLAGPVRVKATLDPGGTVVCPDATIVKALRPGQSGVVLTDWRGYTSRIDFVGQSTGVGKSRVSPFVPRRRVHKASNMAALLDVFANVAEPVQRVRTALANVTFPDGDRASIIQDGISDWSFVGRILDQCRQLAPNANWHPLVMVGGVSSETSGKWVITPGLRDPYPEWNYPEDRKISFDQGDGNPTYQYDEIEDASQVPEFPGGRFPVVGIGRTYRTFSGDRWSDWSTLDVPRFTDNGDIVWRMLDHVSRGPRDDIEWHSFVFAGPPQGRVAGPFQESPLAPWVGIGKVDQTDPSGPWIQVKLDGFEGGKDTADVRLTTPYSGKNEKRGLNFVPEQGSRIVVGWPGRFDTSVVVVGNSRWDPAEFSSPSIFLESTLTAQFEQVHVKRIGDVGIDSSLNVGIQQTTTVNSQDQLKINADGADLKMSGGVVYTGRGM